MKELIIAKVLHYFENLSNAVEPGGSVAGATRDDALYKLEQDLAAPYLEWLDDE